MTPEIQQQLVDWVKNLGNLAVEELPTFVQEISTFGFYSSISYVLVTLIFIAISYIPARICIKNTKDAIDPEFAKGFIWFMYVLFLIIPFVIVVENISCAIKAKVSPRLYAIEKLAK